MNKPEPLLVKGHINAMNKKGKHAIVLGASMAGLLTARALSDHFEHVTLIERDRFPEGAESRKGVPQSRHAHGVLARGLRIMEQLFPGLTRDLIAGGALPSDIALDICWYQFGGYKARFDADLPGIVLSRPFLEAHIRQRVLRLPQLTAIQETEVKGLVANEQRTHVIGVTIQRRGGGEEQWLADLTVDATGRAAQSPKWLEALGYDRPAESAVKVNVGYASHFYHRQPGDEQEAIAYFIGSTPPQGKRGGALLAIEGHRWIATLAGFLGDHPPTDEPGFLGFARSLPTPDIYSRIHKAEPLSEIVVYKFLSNLRRHYEKMTRFPEGYVVLGDALCSFNPVYGQGMTVAALEALTLAECLKAQPNRDMTGLPGRFFKKVTPVVDIPWLMATGEDLRYTEVEGVRPPSMDFINGYTALVHRAAMTDQVVCRTFFNVANLNQSPTHLFHPKILVRVLKANLSVGRTMKLAMTSVPRQTPHVNL